MNKSVEEFMVTVKVRKSKIRNRTNDAEQLPMVGKEAKFIGDVIRDALRDKYGYVKGDVAVKVQVGS